MRTATAIFALMLLAACGQKNALVPRQGASLPVAPYGLDEQPTSTALLEPPPQAMPERSVELRKRSEPRDDDPFDLPPAP
jgi:hypothetical protein